MLTSLQEMAFKEGDTIIKQGDVGDQFFILTRGSASVQFSSKTSTTEVTTLQAGAYFGEMALINDEPRTASIIAGANVECLVCTKVAFQQIVGSVKDFNRRNKNRVEELKEIKGHPTKRNVPQGELVEIAKLGAGTFGRVTT